MSTASELRKNVRDTVQPPDDIDLRLIAELQSDARARVAELGRRVGLSPPAVAERLRRLEDSGAVTFRAEVNPRALGYTLSAIVRVSPMSGHVHAIPDIARQTPEITECYRITGEDCYFMRLYLRSIDDLEPILDRFVAHGRTTTSIVHSAPVPPRSLPAVPGPVAGPARSLPGPPQYERAGPGNASAVPAAGTARDGAHGAGRGRVSVRK
jgi:Lrp/AsnC family transcriptional regulator, leucine-responsive regulatory protein